MFKNYIKIAWRNLWKNKGYSALNIFGLAIGITCASLILLWVEDEVNYDSVFPKQDLVYYVPTNQTFEGEVYTFYSTPGPLAKDLKDEIPEITKSSKTWGGEILLSDGENGINRYGRYVDPDFLDIFSLKFLEGELKGALSSPDGIILTQETAAALFGSDKKVLNRVIKVNDEYSFTVTGVVENLPNNVTFGFNWLLPFERFQLGDEDMSWTEEYGNNFADTFVELAPNSDFKEVDTKVRSMIASKMDSKDDSPNEAFLHSIKDWHLRSDFRGGKSIGGQITFVRLVAFIALIILLIACINFMNLSTARSEKRANEVGVRKVLGSGKKLLISQFMMEALIMAGISALLSVVLVLVLLPSFNTLVEKQIELRLLEPLHLVSLLTITLVSGLLAGWYPALYLSSFRPAQVLKGSGKSQGSATLIRKGLVVTQFAVSIVFIICSIIIYQQIEHVRARDVGYEKENLVNVSVSGDMVNKFYPIREEMIASGTVENVALTNSYMLSSGNNGSGLSWQGGVNTEDVLVRFRYVSPSFFNTVGLEMLEGHGFNDDRAVDSTNVIITQSFAALMGDNSALGKTITRNDTNYNVIGVVKDYLYGDMYGNGKTGPVMFFNNYDFGNAMYIGIRPESSRKEALMAIEKILKEYNPAFPFEYRFENDLFNSRFRNEELVGELSKIFSLLAIIISCLGLLGLAAYTAEQRRKEIGVRKVLGASVSGIVNLLSKDFMRLVFISILIAIPLAWYAMQNWLESFAYRIEINWLVFVIAGVVAITIALLTVSYHAIKSARANPVKSLRTE
ncbi:ABC transporter permease [Maribacter cobaltidurans]|uniref:Acetylornithine deacetylase n=1 Tax=Maribacter cobaltidurans TaxID=1178778 RepID=A0A223V577_9FLAO|nr:ABC transporter permease [Maribacter cobaltidurans]ASV30543.1 acetylornithine deacetylase [Maribacter cobaltidurans]GGD79603.1 ABC transporter permease [Maribacter cobaltidurans]